MNAEPKPNLDQVLHVLQLSEDALEEFDPEIVIGNVEDKIDSIHYILTKMKTTADHLKEVAKPISAKARSIDASRERLREYVLFSMDKHGFAKLPGKDFKAEIREGHHRIVVSAEKGPTPDQAMTYQKFVHTHVNFTWNEEAIQAAFIAGEELPPGVQANHATTKWVAFSAYVPPELEPKKRSRPKK